MVRKRIKKLEARATRLEQKIFRRPKEPGVVTDIGLWEGASDSQCRHPCLAKIKTFAFGFSKIPSHLTYQLGFGFLKESSFLPHQFGFSFLKGIVFRCGRLSFQFETLNFLVTLSRKVKYKPDKEILGLSDQVETNLNP